MINVNVSEIDNITVGNEWNVSENKEYLMHSIHAYPAKFPAFIAAKAFDYAEAEGVDVKKVADIFCGCGTVALEAKLHGKEFWGCDINPVATLIAKIKSDSYEVSILNKYYEKIEEGLKRIQVSEEYYKRSNRRIQYWFTEKSFLDLIKIKLVIEKEVVVEQYKNVFLCLFSAILKASSKWLTKSIKPQIDPDKKEIDIKKIFEKQYLKFVRAVEQINHRISEKDSVEIVNENFLTINELPMVDLIISSPPYVTSYEYADLHQLSTLWLDYAEDYRDLRQGSIGSVYNSENVNLEMESLNEIGKEIVNNLLKISNNKKPTSKVRSVARYYLDMQNVIKRCSKMINNNGMVFFVVGDTEYKGVQVKNSQHLIECLISEGFSEIKAAKRRISNKLLTPYRDDIGRFSSDKAQRTIYHEEFVISGRMCRNE